MREALILTLIIIAWIIVVLTVYVLIGAYIDKKSKERYTPTKKDEEKKWGR